MPSLSLFDSIRDGSFFHGESNKMGKCKYKDEELIGFESGKLTVVKVYYNNKQRHVICKCSCGKEIDFLSLIFISRRPKSCGCAKNNGTKPKHNMWGTRIYEVWADMKNRCCCEKSKCYKNYGGRGIIVCKKWMEFINFYNWAINNGYSDNLTLDRIDNNKGYSPDNCRFTDRHIQIVNQRIRRENKSGYKGVWWNEKEERWESYININHKKYHLGKYKNKKEAVEARNKFIIDNNLKEYPIQEWKGVK